MINWTLAYDYFLKVLIRRKALQTLFDEGGYSDVIPETQESVELLLKGFLRLLGIDPPKWHDVSSVLFDNANLIPSKVYPHLNRVGKFSAYLRKEREISFYGEDDFVPTQNYSKEDAQKCLQELDFIVQLLTPFFEEKKEK